MLNGVIGSWVNWSQLQLNMYEGYKSRASFARGKKSHFARLLPTDRLQGAPQLVVMCPGCTSAVPHPDLSHSLFTIQRILTELFNKCRGPIGFLILLDFWTFPFLRCEWGLHEGPEWNAYQNPVPPEGDRGRNQWVAGSNPPGRNFPFSLCKWDINGV